MKIALRNVLLVSLTLLLATCSKDDEPSLGFPRVRTLEVTDINSSGATFGAEIVSRGGSQVLNRGFAWGEDRDPTRGGDDFVIIPGDASSNNFAKTIQTTLARNRNYFVRAFIETSDFTVYGANVVFTSLGSLAPTITSIAPLEGTLGERIMISGKNFSSVKENNKVLFNDEPAWIVSNTDSTITALVPDALRETTSRIAVEIVGNRSTFPASFNLLPPIIESISSDQGRTGDTLTIRGQNLGYTEKHPQVYFGEELAKVYFNHTDSIDVFVPPRASGTLRVQVANQSDEIAFNYLMPAFNNFSPASVTWGDTVTLYGENFYRAPSLQSLALNTVPYPFLETYEDSLVFIVDEDVLTNDGTGPNNELDITIDIAGFRLALSSRLQFKPPTVLDISPDTVDFGDLVTLDVSDFHPTSNQITLQYQGRTRPEIASVPLTISTRDKIQFEMPTLSLANRQNSDNNITVRAIAEGVNISSTQALTIKAPIIYSFSPTVVANPGDQITIQGKNFGESPLVQFGAVNLEIISASDNEMIISIPEEIFRDPVISEYLENVIGVTVNGLTGRSTENLVIDHVTNWNLVNDGGLFEIKDGFLDQRTSFQLVEHESFGYLLGGRGKLVECCFIPGGLERLKDVWRFNPSNNTWNRLANWPQQDKKEELIEAFPVGDFIYAITSNARIIKYDINNNLWAWVSNVTEGAGYYQFLLIDNRRYIVYRESITNSNSRTWISTLNLSNGTQNNLLELPFTYSGLDNLYEYNGKIRYRRYLQEEEYEYDPLANTFTLVRSIDRDLKVIKHLDAYYSFNLESIYQFDPATGEHSAGEDLPANEFVSLRFSLGDRLYFGLSKNRMVSYDVN